MSFPDRQQRKICWDSRDRYWECLDDQNIKESSEKPKACLELRRIFEKSCPTQWVTHFDRKRDFNVFKEKMQKEGGYKMEELAKLIELLNIDTRLLNIEIIQDLLVHAKRCKKTSENTLEEWNRIAEVLWSHIQTGLDKMDDQLLCTTCFFSVIILTDKQELYIKKMHKIIENEITSRSMDLKDSSCALQAVSLMYGMFQSSFLQQSTEKLNIILVVNSTFSLLTMLGYEYSQFTFIVFKTMNSFKKVCGTDLQEVIYSKQNQVKLLSLINHNWENPITGIRDLNKGIFQTLVTILDRVMLKSIVLEINGFYWNKAKYLMLSEVIEDYKGDICNLVSQYNWTEGLINSLHKPGLVSAGADMYYAILKNINSEDVWCELFLQRILEVLRGSSNKAIENFGNYWLLISLKKFPLLMNILIDELEKCDDTNDNFFSILFLMKQGNKLGILTKNLDSTDSFTKTDKIVLSAIESNNTQVRILAFDIVCFRQDKTLPSRIEYTLLLDYIKNNINSDCTVLRLNMLSSLNIFLSQLHILFRNLKGNFETESLLNFCQNLQELIITSLNLNGNYQRKCTNVRVINTIIDCLSQIPKKRKDHINPSSTSLKEFLQCNDCWILHDKKSVFKLLSLLKDPSDDIRENVGKLLLHHYSAELRKTEMINQLVQEALQSMSSKFFFEISCGQSMFKLIVNLLLKENHEEAMFKNVDDVFKYGYMELMAEYELKRDALKSIEYGKQLHSFISILHVVLEICIKNTYNLDIPDVNISDLLNVLQGVTNQFTWEQQNSTSSDFSKMNEMVENIIAKSGNDHSERDETKISGLHQIVLNCLWLNVKASCDLALLIMNYYKDDIQKCEKALTIITHVLETSRHKGAIEAAGNALGCGIQLLTSLPEDEKTSKLPWNLLKSKLEILILEASKMASITRRGAGLSIMVHRIVSNDMRKGKPLFHYFMKTLLRTCQKTEDIPTSQEEISIENQMDLPKAIFIHFLTKIVMDSSLASDMMFYSAELAELAFGNLASSHWQIRNAALQLYGALIPKLIGQKKPSGTDDETIATVACDELRTHSPKLWTFITEQLKVESHTNKIISHSNLVPILNMLASSAKRYNFSYDSRELVMSDKELLKSLIGILDSPIHTVRRLSAKCIFNIFEFGHIFNVLMKVDFKSENHIHGALMLLKYCFQYYNLKDTNDIAAKALKHKFRSVLDRDKYSYCSKELYLSIFSNCDVFRINDLVYILTILKEKNNFPGVFNWAQTCIKICLMNSQWDIIPEFLSLLLNHNDFEIYCEIFLCKMEAEKCTSKSVLNQIVNILLAFKKKYFSCVIWRILYEISLISNLSNINITEILKDVDGKESSYKLRYIIPLAARLFVNISDQYQKKLAKVINNMCNYENTDAEMRYIAALANNELPKSFNKISDDVKVNSLKTAIILLQDEDEDVRNVCVYYYKNIRNLEIALHPNLCLNKLLDCNFLCSIFCESQQVIVLCKDLLQLLSNNAHSHIDEYNPFANESKNIYLEVDVLRNNLETIMNKFE